MNSRSTDAAVLKAERRVIRAAVRWVNVDDNGRVDGLMRLTRAQTELARAVGALESARLKAKR